MGMQSSRLGISIIALFIACVITLCMSHRIAIAGAIVKAEGVLIAKEGKKENRSVIINKKGYLVFPSARLVDAANRTISLERIAVPSRVYFHYEYTKAGPFITFMKVYPKVVPQ